MNGGEAGQDWSSVLVAPKFASIDTVKVGQAVLCHQKLTNELVYSRDSNCKPQILRSSLYIKRSSTCFFFLHLPPINTSLFTGDEETGLGQRIRYVHAIGVSN